MDDAFTFPPGTSPRVMAEGTVQALLQLAAELREEIAELGKRLDAAEQVKFMGVWQKQIEYQPGNFCTRSGALWHADRPSKGVAPGSSPEHWTMAVKSGAGQ